MHIVVRSNFDVTGMLGRESVELAEGSSVRSLLNLLSRKCGVNLIDAKSGKVSTNDFTITLNGKENPFWPQGLETKLKDADEIQVFVMPLGGG